jgi:hypothetical protein
MCLVLGNIDIASAIHHDGAQSAKPTPPGQQSTARRKLRDTIIRWVGHKNSAGRTERDTRRVATPGRGAVLPRGQYLSTCPKLDYPLRGRVSGIRPLVRGWVAACIDGYSPRKFDGGRSDQHLPGALSRYVSGSVPLHCKGRN